MERKNAVIVAFGRSAVAKAIKGSLRYTGCVDFGSQVLKGILAKTPGFDPALAEDLIEKSRAEEGNILYSLNVNLKDPHSLAFVEFWKDQDAIKEHKASEHFTEAFPKLAALCDQDPVVDLYAEL